MPPAASNRERILENIKTTLAAITAGATYNYTPGEALLGLKSFTELSDEKFPAYYVAGADEERKNVTNSEFRSDIKVSIAGYLKISDASTPEELERQISRAVADVTKALYVDITRGGYSTFTEIETIDTDKGSWAPIGGFEMVVKCQYRASVSAP